MGSLTREQLFLAEQTYWSGRRCDNRVRAGDRQPNHLLEADVLLERTFILREQNLLLVASFSVNVDVGMRLHTGRVLQHRHELFSEASSRLRCTHNIVLPAIWENSIEEAARINN